jgi:D-cysteine desulfhydrase
MCLQDVPREPLLALPTAFHRLNRLSELYGSNIWIKRDDLTGFAMGGNKGRKLEFLMADALREKADCVVTCGAIQSNHARQTAVAARKLGMESFLVLLGSEGPQNGNLLLERWVSAKQIYVGGDLWERRDPKMWRFLLRQMYETVRELIEQGRKPYAIRLGGSTPLGAMGFAQAVVELNEQCIAMKRMPFDYIVFASSSGGTHTGLHLGCRALGLKTKVLGVSIEPEDIRPEIAELANATCGKLGVETRYTIEDIHLNREFYGDGYAIPTPEGNEAIKLLACSEGIYLDPVYTGKAMAGLIGMIANGEIKAGSSILFWHTGGSPVLFAEDYVNLV